METDQINDQGLRTKALHKLWLENNKYKVRSAQMRWYYKNREAFLEKRKKWYKENREKICAERREYYQENKEMLKGYDYKEEAKYKRCAREAKKRGIAFELTCEEFSEFWQKPCSYCGAEIKTAGLDRVNNNFGYLYDNVVSCCWTCNYMKRTTGKMEFIEHCRKIVAFQSSIMESS